MYVEIPCVIKSEYFIIRKVFGLIISCGAVFIYLFSTTYLDYLACVQNNKYIEFDVKTITAGDYSIEFEITND